MSDERPDSLAAELKRKKVFAEYFAWCSLERPTPADKLAKLQTWGIESSSSALYRLHKSAAAFQWRSQSAREAREAMDAQLPADIKGALRESLLRLRYDQTLGDLSSKEIIDLSYVQQGEDQIEIKRLKLAQDAEKLALDRKKFQRDTCELYLKWSEDSRAKEIAASGATHSEKIEQLGRAMFDDWDEA